MVVEQLFQLLRIHDRRDLLGQLVHVAVAALQAEGRLGAVTVILGGTGDVLQVDPVDHLAHLEQTLQGGDDLVDLCLAVGMAEVVAGDLVALRARHQQVEVGHVTGGQRCQHRVGGQAVFDVAELERLFHPAQHIAKVVDVGAVGQHVRNLEHLAGFGIRIAGHHHAELLATQVIGPAAPAPDTLDAAGAVAQRDELLQELRMGVLDVIQVQHGVAAHLQRQIDLLQFLARGGIGRLCRIQ